MLFAVLVFTVGPLLVRAEVPQQIHLSFGVNCSQMMVTWLTLNASHAPTVRFGVSDRSLSTVQRAHSTRFVDGGRERRAIFVHRALLSGLKEAQEYYYRCEDGEDKSPVYSFVTTREDQTDARLLVYGDLGLKNPQSLGRVLREVLSREFHALLHIGDFAYDLDSDNARVGDSFMRLVEPIAARLPYQTCPGNHEFKYNFSNYDNRFSMLARDGHVNNHFYSFAIGPVKVISFSTEFYYYREFGSNQIKAQFEWLQRELKLANQERVRRPWLVTMAHKPFYCQTLDTLCQRIDSTNSFQRRALRLGLKDEDSGNGLRFGLERLFKEHKVDIELFGHEHNYQRLFPVFDNHVLNGSHSAYHNPRAPVVIVSGSAGCQEDIAPFRREIPEWSAFRNSDYGFTRLLFHNKSHVTVEQVSDDQARVVDRVLIVKD